MKNFLNKLLSGLRIVIVVLIAFGIIIGCVLFINAKESNVREQAYAEGQYDALHGGARCVVLLKEATSDIDKIRKLAYAQGHDNALDGDIRIAEVTDSTFVWITSPWGKDKEVPTDTLKIVR